MNYHTTPYNYLTIAETLETSRIVWSYPCHFLPPQLSKKRRERKKKERKEQDLYPFKKWSDVEWRPTERSRGEGGRRRERRKESEAEGAADRAHPWLGGGRSERGGGSGASAEGERARRKSEKGWEEGCWGRSDESSGRERCLTGVDWVGDGGRGGWRRTGGGGTRKRERVECSIFEEEDGGGRAFLNLCPRMLLVIPICNASNPLIARNFDVTVQHRAMGIDGASRLHPEYLCLPLILLFALLVSLTPTSVSDHGKIVPSGDIYIYMAIIITTWDYILFIYVKSNAKKINKL